MPALSVELRSTFEREVVRARDTAEGAARAALTTLAVERDRPFDAMSEEKRALRRALRARARQLGEGNMNAGMLRLIEEIAYEQWHRMLFARFLAENNLLMHPEGVAVTLEECAELAREEGAADLWAVATRYASAMLPGIFREADPALKVRFAPEGRHKLEQIVTDLPRPVFSSDDGLGWAYQFWQSKKKDEVNASERKIGGSDIAPVTQLFTEDYMVKFLLHNTLGAWWAHRHPDSPLNEAFEYLRYQEDGTPAAGTFGGWPGRVGEVTMMDPCGGSGHFVVAAFEMFYRMRMEEEGLNAAEAGNAVMRENVHMLELDPRCTQIAAFNLALAAWKAGGYRELPVPNIACSGIPVQGQLEDWIRLAGGNQALKWALERLHRLFRNAPTLGSLINPGAIPVEERMFVGDYEQVRPLLDKALRSEDEPNSDVDRIQSEAVRGTARAAELLSQRYVFVATNVPYLTRGLQNRILMDFCEEQYRKSKADLATVFIERCRYFTVGRGSYSLVTPQNWTFLSSYEELRKELLEQQAWHHVCWLGPGAFETISGEVVKPVLTIMSNLPPGEKQTLTGIDAAQSKSVVAKSFALKSVALTVVRQREQLLNPDGRIILVQSSHDLPLLSFYADGIHGLGTKDSPRFIRQFWEVPDVDMDWEFMQSSVTKTTLYGGMEKIVFWQQGRGILHDLAKTGAAILAGGMAHGRPGVLVSQVGSLSATLYHEGLFEKSAAVISSHNPFHLRAIWAFCSAPEFSDAVRRIDRKVAVTNRTLVKVPFDLDYWQEVADEKDPLPSSYSNDPTQWIFAGLPQGATKPLQVAVVRSLGYTWPQQRKDRLSSLADDDGIVCLPSVAAEPPANDRIRTALSKAHENEWSLEKQRQLLAAVDLEGRSLADWLRDGFFKQHCKLFKSRPFIWHIWDGRKDGFSALVNYHKLDHAKLERLIYSYLGDWISTQQAEQEEGVAGAEGRLVAALELKKKLELILEGEPLYDIYVRWKPLHEQPIGWNPDLNDGVRLNIRPFVKAGVLRSKFTIHWKKDRGKNPDGSERHNDLHVTRAEKEEARRIAGVL